MTVIAISTFPAAEWECVSYRYKDGSFIIPRLRIARSIGSDIGPKLKKECLEVLRREGGVEWNQYPFGSTLIEQAKDVAIPVFERLFGSLSNDEVT